MPADGPAGWSLPCNTFGTSGLEFHLHSAFRSSCRVGAPVIPRAFRLGRWVVACADRLRAVDSLPILDSRCMGRSPYSPPPVYPTTPVRYLLSVALILLPPTLTA